ncbi:MAG: tricarballylate utilization 4Fe-4S protein TcuB [Hyphomicrobiales bacterium]|nr:tricarballylate utilization 4Fe-4S protein TcuB [Hyphomicrobiales bacterium]
MENSRGKVPVAMSLDIFEDARRQIEICNACRYCEGYCSVFPAITRERVFTDGDIIQLANLCHNCRGCYYACPYIEPHEFALNVPGILADVRQESWQRFAWPNGLARLFDRSGVVIASLLVLAITFIFVMAQALRPVSGDGFYAYMSHGLMVGIFVPAFVFPLAAMGISMRRYWSAVGAVGWPSWRHFRAAFVSAVRMKNLSGGHGDGCNFEDEDRFTHMRTWFHHATFYGFMLCFASTCSGTIMHYFFDMPAPYGLLSAPKLLGIPGGVLLCFGTAGLAWLKIKSDPKLGARTVWGAEMSFIALLFLVSATGLGLYAATGTTLVPGLLALHLGSVLTLFVLLPYSKMVHGFYRLAALLRDEVTMEAKDC